MSLVHYRLALEGVNCQLVDIIDLTQYYYIDRFPSARQRL